MEKNQGLKDMGDSARYLGSLDKSVQKEFKDQVTREILDPTVRAIKVAAMSAPVPQSRIASDSVVAENKRQPMIIGAAGGGLPARLFHGAEFGGGNAVTLVRNKQGTQYWRHSTRQFGTAHNKDGYFFLPTIARRGDEIMAAGAQIYRDVVKNLVSGGGP